jgi:hypothetical protein
MIMDLLKEYLPQMGQSNINQNALNPSEEQKEQIGSDLISMILNGTNQPPQMQQPMARPQSPDSLVNQRAPNAGVYSRQQNNQSKVPAGQAQMVKNVLQSRAERYSPQKRASNYRPMAAPMPQFQPQMQQRQMQMAPAPQQPQMYQNLGQQQRPPQSPMYAFNPNQMFR